MGFGKFMIETIARRNGGDLNYTMGLYETSSSALKKLGNVGKLLSHRESISVEAAYAAQITGSMAEGCGSCVQQHIEMARNAGVSEDQTEAIISGQTSLMSSDSVLAVRFANAIIFKTDDEFPAREEVEKLWGKKGIVDLTMATQTSRFLSMAKYGFGYATECTKLRVGEREVVPNQA